MKLRNRWLIKFLSAGVAALVWCWLRTMRFSRFSVDGRHHPSNPASEQYLYALWHEAHLGPLCDPGQCKVLISQHADGEWIAQVCQWLGLGVIRGSTTRGGCQAVHSMIQECGSNNNIVVTPDGPRGPRRQMQSGAVWVSSTTGIPVVLLGIGYSRAWRANSWDRFAVPVPGSHICAVASAPVCIPPDLDRAGLEHWRLHLEAELERVSGLAEEWAARVRVQGRNAAPPEMPAQPAANKKAA
ncbi:lysophospholipid acyltransferase family protein [Anatilimnocola floriformis]|uniref:lysophospholipid acyltransferase family protein n=1 Tax=Anatilimnocola floriformis TaxID=2948575 RepID=UPI0020C2F73F|nr:lysophospholipid acyltransferase family protein [Anatilimnocola floriformis]